MRLNYYEVRRKRRAAVPRTLKVRLQTTGTHQKNKSGGLPQRAALDEKVTVFVKFVPALLFIRSKAQLRKSCADCRLRGHFGSFEGS
jgi:hypothetical protein